MNVGKYIIIIGGIILVIGLIVYLFPGTFRWVGRLPGDIRVEKENSSFYFPVVTMIVVSVVLSIIANVLRKLL